MPIAHYYLKDFVGSVSNDLFFFCLFIVYFRNNNFIK